MTQQASPRPDAAQAGRSLIQTAALYASGQSDPIRETERVLHSMEVCPDKAIFTRVTPERAKQEAAASAKRHREGRPAGLLDGVVLLKDKSPYADYAALKAAGSKITVAVLQNVYAEPMVHAALPDAKVDQYDSPDLMYQALNSGQADAAATDQSSAKWLILKTPGMYRDAGYGWNPQTYACAMPRGDQQWINFVDTVFHEAMTGVDFDSYKASFKKWFGVDLPPPAIGFPVEYK